MKKVTLRIPATTANLGPGFDSLGCALALYNTITCEILPDDRLVIAGCPKEYQNEQNLAVQGYRAVLDRLGLPREGLAVTIAAEIPVCRGLGSSAALIAGGAAAANLLHGAPLSRAELLDVTNAIEGHPDNLAPAIFGGLTASLVEEGHAHTVQLPLCQRLRWVAAVPDFELSTHTARGVLPAAVPFADAVYNASRAAVLVGALACGDHDLLRCALRDRLHQPYRYALIPEAGAVETTARECGALAFCSSGAGPTLLRLTDGPGFAGRLTVRCAALCHDWQIIELAIDRQGITVTEQPE